MTAENRKPEPKKPDALTYEEAVTRLRSITQLLDSDLPLEKTVALYEEGKQLLAYCDRILRQAEQKITVLEPAAQKPITQEAEE